MLWESSVMVPVTSCTWEAMRPEGAEPGRRLCIPGAAFLRDDCSRGVNEYDD
jgi:hypothetical protein